jgi:dephospho-CoA kinase
VGGSDKKPIIGILGGIGSGKTAVASEFGRLGCRVIDADRIAHEALDRKDIKQIIVRLCGEAILDPSGRIDRKKLSYIVFADADKLASLNKIIHPFVLKRAEQLIERYSRQSRVKAIVLDMPLLVEVGWAKRCSGLIFVDCQRPLRLDRAKKMGFDENQIKMRENFQISLDSKADIADNIIDNNSDFRALARQVTDIFACIVDKGRSA